MRSSKRQLALVRLVHTVIYLVMAGSTLFILFAGVSGYVGTWLYVSLVLVGIEGAVFLGNGMKCPLTSLAVRYGAEKGYAFDTFLPEKATRYTFRFFGTLLLIGLVFVILRAIGSL
jgi:hypothetical protein